MYLLCHSATIVSAIFSVAPLVVDVVSSPVFLFRFSWQPAGDALRFPLTCFAFVAAHVAASVDFRPLFSDPAVAVVVVCHPFFARPLFVRRAILLCPFVLNF